MLNRKKMVAIGMIFMAITSFAKAKYVFYFIGDGMGAGQRQITEEYQRTVLKNGDKLLVNSLPVAGITTTYSADTLITDSAASGTALATGYKTNNGYVAKDANGNNLTTILELARSKGMATGIVTTTRLTHATPAVFVSHNINRDNENEIAEDYVKSGVDYFAGGGYRHFTGKDSDSKSKRKDSRDLVKEFENKGYMTFIGEDSAQGFEKWKPAAGQKVFAAFQSSHMPYSIDEKSKNLPSLKMMTEKGIELLSQDKDGFFMMIEGGRIDHASHAQDVQSTIYDTLALDEAVKKAYDFYEKYPEDTLIVVAADHETGGMGLGFGNNYFMNLDQLKNVKVSIEDTLQNAYTGDREAYFKYLAVNMGLSDLTQEEKNRIIKGMDLEDKKETKDSSQLYGGYSPTAIAVAHIVSERAGMQWTTFAHTGTQVPLSAIGKDAERFGGFKDNTDIAKAIAESMGMSLD